MRKTFPDTFQDFNFEVLKSQHFWKQTRKSRLSMARKSQICGDCRLIIDTFTGFKPSRAVRLCRSCLQRFGDLRKNTPWSFGVCILWMLTFFVDFRVHKVANSSTTLHLYTYLYVLAPPWSYSISEIRNPVVPWWRGPESAPFSRMIVSEWVFYFWENSWPARPVLEHHLYWKGIPIPTPIQSWPPAMAPGIPNANMFM